MSTNRHFSTTSGVINSNEVPAAFGYSRSALNQAAVFLEDALTYRSIYHKVDERTLHLYRFYYSKPTQWFIYFIVFIIHILAFFETPSSLTSTWSSDLRNVGTRWKAPCGSLEAVEMICLLVLLADQVLKSHLIGWQRVKSSNWILIAYVFLFISIADCIISLSLGCGEVVRVRRMLRPFFVIQRSTMMKKVWNCLRRTLPEIASVLLLLLAHLYFFTMFGMLLFPTPRLPQLPVTSSGKQLYETINQSSPGNQSVEDDYFRSFNTSIISLLVLLTTANNPDVMMPAYTKNRFYALYFIIFLTIGLYCLMNMLTAVIYNQFRGYFKASMTSSVFRRHLGIRAAYEMLWQRQRSLSRISTSVQTQGDGGVPKDVVMDMLPQLRLRKVTADRLNVSLSYQPAFLTCEEFTEVFIHCDKKKASDHQETPIPWLPHGTIGYRLQTIITHPAFNYLGCVVVLSNVIAISVLFSTQYDLALGSVHSSVHTMNLCFAIYYIFEKSLLIWANGKKRFFESKLEIFDCVILAVIVVLEIVFLGVYSKALFPSKGDPDELINDPSVWRLVKTINLFIIFRFIRLLPQIKTMYVVLVSMLDIARNLAPFGGLLLALYYLFAILGMELFAGTISAPNSTVDPSAGPALTGYGCGTYEQLEYWANNFDDFAASLVVLWDIMVVNNWHIFLQVYSEKVSPWSQLYFITFWLLSVIVSVNLFTAIILENFIMRWDRHHAHLRELRGRSESLLSNTFSLYNTMSVHEMFRHDIDEPQEEELLAELRRHEHVSFDV